MKQTPNLNRIQHNQLHTQVKVVFESMSKSKGNTLYVSFGKTKTWVDITPLMRRSNNPKKGRYLWQKFNFQQ